MGRLINYFTNDKYCASLFSSSVQIAGPGADTEDVGFRGDISSVSDILSSSTTAADLIFRDRFCLLSGRLSPSLNIRQPDKMESVVYTIPPLQAQRFAALLKAPLMALLKLIRMWFCWMDQDRLVSVWVSSPALVSVWSPVSHLPE
jgi:hypothetical protein